MKHLPDIFLLLAAWLAAFLQCAFDLPQRFLGAQVDLLPLLVVYAALNSGTGWLALTAGLGGLWVDSLSANPPGTSTLALLAAGAAVHHHRAIILRREWVAQVVLGLAVSAAVPVLKLLVLFTFGHAPLLGWASLGQWLFLTVAGGAGAPLVFGVLDWLRRRLREPAGPASGFAPEREIVRGRI